MNIFDRIEYRIDRVNDRRIRSEQRRDGMQNEEGGPRSDPRGASGAASTASTDTRSGFPAMDSADPQDVSWSQDSSPVRLHLKNAKAASGYFDGGWWPRSSDPGQELGALLRAVEAIGGHPVQQVMVNTTHWATRPPHVTVADRVVPTIWLPACATTTVRIVLGLHRYQIDLLVVPPQTDPEIAATALDIASAYSGTSDGADILRAAAVRAGLQRSVARKTAIDGLPQPQDKAEDARWESDGGRVRA